MTAGKCGFNFERAPRFRAALQKVLSPYKELYNRKVYEARQSSILLYFKTATPATPATVDDKLTFYIKAGRHTRRCTC